VFAHQKDHIYFLLGGGGKPVLVSLLISNPFMTPIRRGKQNSCPLLAHHLKPPPIKTSLYLHGGEKALEVLPVQLPINGAAAALRWKSQRIKIHLGWPMDFYRFLNPYPSLWIFYWKSQRFGQKSRDFWFANIFLEIFKIPRLVWIFLWIFGCF
jgi:hypothetical protein